MGVDAKCDRSHVGKLNDSEHLAFFVIFRSAPKTAFGRVGACRQRQEMPGYSA